MTFRKSGELKILYTDFINNIFTSYNRKREELLKGHIFSEKETIDHSILAGLIQTREKLQAFLLESKREVLSKVAINLATIYTKEIIHKGLIVPLTEIASAISLLIDQYNEDISFLSKMEGIRELDYIENYEHYISNIFVQYNRHYNRLFDGRRESDKPLIEKAIQDTLDIVKDLVQKAVIDSDGKLSGPLLNLAVTYSNQVIIYALDVGADHLANGLGFVQGALTDDIKFLHEY